MYSCSIQPIQPIQRVFHTVKYTATPYPPWCFGDNGIGIWSVAHGFDVVLWLSCVCGMIQLSPIAFGGVKVAIRSRRQSIWVTLYYEYIISLYSFLYSLLQGPLAPSQLELVHVW